MHWRDKRESNFREVRKKRETEVERERAGRDDVQGEKKQLKNQLANLLGKRINCLGRRWPKGCRKAGSIPNP